MLQYLLTDLWKKERVLSHFKTLIWVLKSALESEKKNKGVGLENFTETT